ncbi:MAG TPA: polysaccharide deacetylase family protein [Pyrinomonadaceae bacterium]|nr:polysaccharide deacetylase family protein [Pyrinomonadaceae bacterium]
MYHSISRAGDRLAVAPEPFAAEMQFLAEQGFQVISLEKACRLLASNSDLSRTIVLTFDDGHRDFLTRAAPVLKQHRFTATLFAVTGCMGETSKWSSTDKRLPLLTREELCELKAQGFHLGSHSVSHADLRTLDDAALERELVESRAAIAAMGETFIPFAYPGGTFTRRERDAVERSGYQCGVIVGGRWGNGPETDRFLLKREPMLGSDSLEWFKKRVNGFYEAHYLMARARGVETR